MEQLTETGLLSLWQIIGREAVTEKQAEDNRKRKKGPKRARSAVPALIPVKKSCWWAGVQSCRFPKPVKIGNGRGTFWRAADIQKLISSASKVA